MQQCSCSCSLRLIFLIGLVLAAAASSYISSAEDSEGEEKISVGTAALISINSTSASRQYRACYVPPTHLIPSTQLAFNISKDNVKVVSTLTITPNPQWQGFLRSPAAAAAAELGCSSLPGDAKSTPTANDSSTARGREVAADGALVVAPGEVPPLVLDGESLTLLDIKLDGQPLATGSYTLTDTGLALLQPPNRQFMLQITNLLSMRRVTGMTGMARSSSGTYITQCEAQGFRRLTYFLDRPDVRSNFTVRIEADESACPVLLSNGNLLALGKLPHGRHYAVFEDPLPKPSYLFALVAGPLALGAEGNFTSSITGRTTTLHVYTPTGFADQVQFTLQSLQQSMAWDEAMYRRHYDLELYNLVGTEIFSPTGMENQALNILQLSNLATSLDTHTDSEAQAIQQLVAHEYFHEWSGNRVTLRDWFDLTLKEGLTQFRQQLFAADIDSASLAAAVAVAPPISNASLPLDPLLADAVEEAQQGASANSTTAGSTNASTNTSSTDYASSDEDYEESDPELDSTGRRLAAAAAAAAPSGPTAPASAWQAAVSSSTAADGKPTPGSLQPQVLQLLRSFSPSSAAAAAAESGWHRVLHVQRLWGSRLLYDDVRPDSYRSPGMLYTSTTYDKGAEIVRMYYTMLGPLGFARGLERFFNTHDMQSVTFEELHASLAAANPATNVSGLLPWLRNDSPPTLSISSSWDDSNSMLSITVEHKTSQDNPPLIPCKIGVLDADGNGIPLALSTPTPGSTPGSPLLMAPGTTAMLDSTLYNSNNTSSNSVVLLVSQPSQTFKLQLGDAGEPAAVSLLRDYSAPVHVEGDAFTAGTGFLAQYDSNPFTRWYALQHLATALLLKLYYAADKAGTAGFDTLAEAAKQTAESSSDSDSGESGNSMATLQRALKAVLVDSSLDGQYKALLLQLPSVSQLQSRVDENKPLLLYQVRSWLLKRLAAQLKPQLLSTVQQADKQLAALQVFWPPAPAAASTPAAALIVLSSTGRKLKQTVPPTRTAASMAVAAGMATLSAALEQYTGLGAADGFSPPAVKARAVRSAALGILNYLQDSRLQRQVEGRYYDSTCLSDRLTVFQGLEGTTAYNRTLSHFYATYGTKRLALLKWFRIQATSEQPRNTEHVRKLMYHPAFDESDSEHCTALLVSFADSVVNFHATDGSGYSFVADAVLQVDSSNSYCAARLVRTLGAWSNVGNPYKGLMCKQLLRLKESASSLSDDTTDAVQWTADGCPSA